MTTDLAGIDALSRRLAKHRAALGWTQSALAGRVGVSRVALSHFEGGVALPNERTVTLLAGVFGVEPHELVAGTDYPEAKAERLPLVANRHTEVDLCLSLLAADLSWIDRLEEAGMVPERLAELADDVRRSWRVQLLDLARRVADPAERSRVTAARRRLA